LINPGFCNLRRRHIITRILSGLAFSVFFPLFVALFLTACSSSGGGVQKAQEQSVYDRVMQSGKIRCGYVLYSPGCIKDANTGKLSGIGIDTILMVAKNLGLEVQFSEEVGWGTMLEGLQTNRYDMIATPIWTNSNRARLVDFGRPIYYSPIFAWVKAGDKRFNGNNIGTLDAPKYKISTVDGETAEVIANEDFPRATRISVPQLSGVEQILLNVAGGKADASFEEPAVAYDFLKHNPGTIEAVKMDRPIRVFPNCWMFRRNQMEFKNMLDTALAQVINSGAVEKIIEKYEKFPGTLYRVARPYDQPVAK
jgi:ABC-type amino acid transport substrate-binding protein